MQEEAYAKFSLLLQDVKQATSLEGLRQSLWALLEFGRVLRRIDGFVANPHELAMSAAMVIGGQSEDWFRKVVGEAVKACELRLIVCERLDAAHQAKIEEILKRFAVDAVEED